MPIARYPSFVYDCPDPGALARFYGTLLGWEVEEDADGGWADIRPADRSSCLSFQRVDDYRPPSWPSQDVPQQLHLDVMVPDLDGAEAEVLEIGATRAEHQPGTTFRVFSTPPATPSASASPDRRADRSRHRSRARPRRPTVALWTSGRRRPRT